jgi:phenylpyruvate tautomerase PptA (4-oxalocrotonate tautomerase family)
MLAVVSNSQSKILQELNTANKTLPSWLLPFLSNTELARASRPDIILVLPNGSNYTPHVHVQDLPPSNWDVHLIEFKYCDDTRPESQLQKAEEQHRRLVLRVVATFKTLGCSKASLHVLLMGVMGTTYKISHRPHSANLVSITAKPRS